MQSGTGVRSSSSASASPSSSSSAVSAPHLGFDLVKHQHQIASFRQSLQQQQLRMSDGDELPVAYRAGGIHGVIPLHQQSMMSHQQGGSQISEENQNKGQALEQHVRNPIHQAYLQYAALQAAHQKSHMNKMQELMPIYAKKLENYQQIDQGTATCYQESELKPPQATIGNSIAANTMRTKHLPHAQSTTTHNSANANTQLATSQLQALQAWALERNIDLSLPANANLMAQILPLWQSRMAAVQKSNEINSHMPLSKQSVKSSPTVASENSAHGDSSSDVSGQVSSAKTRHGSLLPGSFPTSGTSPQIQNPPERISRGNGIPTSVTPEKFQIQQLKKFQHLNQHASQSAVSGDCPIAQLPSEGGPVVQARQQRFGFTSQQLHVLKAQILAFRRLKRGEGALPQEVMLAIAPPPLDTQPQQVFLSRVAVNHDRVASKNVEERVRDIEINEKTPQIATLNKDKILPKEEFISGEEAAATEAKGSMKESLRVGSVGKEEQTTASYVERVGSVGKAEVERVVQMSSITVDIGVERGKGVPLQGASSDTLQVKKANLSLTKDVAPTRKYHGPLFDFPFFIRKHDSFGSATPVNNNNNLTVSYDVKDLLFEEGMEVLHKKRTEDLEKIGRLLTVNLERKRIRPDLVLRLKIEEKKLRLLDTQARVRDEVDKQQEEIMAMPDRPYRKFVQLCERERIELGRQVQLSQKVNRERQLKSIFQWRKKLLEAHWAIRDARTARNRGIAKYHEQILRDFSKRKDEAWSKRMEALKNNDVDRYREMLLEQQTNINGYATQRYDVLSSFLSQTEEYLRKLGGKITAAKNNQEVEEATNAAAVAARSQGLSVVEVRAAATCAGEEVMIRNRFSEMNAPRENAFVNKYYNLAHAVNERVVRQPSMLRAGTLRDYQLVGLQWMLSLYNNKLNGILADEMGLGKTVQVMALIAYLMEFKGNYGPHLIIVPNAVLVNWKSELHNWLPSVSCIFYVGVKDQRSKLFSQEVCALKFNVLVTTYEFVMYDRAKLSRIDWKYIIIDEAQRMKDRESVLAHNLDRYHCQRRLLLTGTPLQNDLKELWSLLNLLLPEVFDNCKAFHVWFSKPFQKDGSSEIAEDDWLETEKKVIIIHRLHQILEPFMLRRRVEDVEGSLPPKVSIVLRCRMSAIQGAIYDWVKSTGTIRVDPEDELRRVEKNPNYQVKMYKNLSNRCMELRKTCNHPLLNYPYFDYYSRDFIVRSCGKLWILDRILVKLHRTGHRVLLFSTMTKLLDILEEYLQWRRLVYRRIDGTTSLEDRESAIVDFNSPNSDCFIFLLSIRAAGRGLNLQTADTVIIYDPDPNPKNEEQAVARAHRIGQKREVKVIYMEVVVDKISSYQKEDELRGGGTVDSEDDLAGKDQYIGSIESLIRSNIQQYKIDMADEVINAGRFDQRTTHEERRLTLETLLHDEERYQETVHNVPSLSEINHMIARSKEEVELFDQMDEGFDWTGEMMKYDQVPIWLRAGSREVNEVISKVSKTPSKANFVSTESKEMLSELSLTKTERKRGRPGKKYPIYRELNDQDGEDYETSSEERNAYSLHDEEGEIGDFDNDEISGAVGASPSNVDQAEDEGAVFGGGGYEISLASEGVRRNHIFEAGSSGSSEVHRLATFVSPSISSQKFGSLSALDARPGSLSTRMPDELEEGEIALSGDSHMDLRQSGSCIHDRDDYDEQVLQPTIKRKRSIRIRPRNTSSTEKLFPHTGNSSQFLSQADRDYEVHLRTKPKLESGGSVLKQRPDLTSIRRANSSPKLHVMPNPGKANILSRERLDDKVMNTGGMRMSVSTRKKCKNVISKLQRRINEDGHQLVPPLTIFWKSSLLELHRIDQRLDGSEYNGVMDFLVDVQLSLKNAAQHCGYSYEVRSDARKLQDLFFDIMKIAFPDMDFREARNMVSFSGPSPKPAAASQSKRNKLFKEVVENDPGPMKRSACGGPAMAGEDVDVPVHQPKFYKESRVASHRDLIENAPLVTHPGDLLISKKKRKDRDKSRAGYESPRSHNTIPHVSGPIHKEAEMTRAEDHQYGLTHQMDQKAGGSGGRVGGDSSRGGGAHWASPVKRMRTDSGKRRPSHI